MRDLGYGRAGTKAARVRRAVHDLLLEHGRTPGGIPTSGRFVFYELEQRGEAVKPDPADPRPNNRRSRGWPPGEQDVIDALTWLRERAVVPWSWIVDESRSLDTWLHAESVADYLRDRLPEATINPWGDEPPPLILCESRATAGVLRAVVGEYVCPIAGTAGHCGGFLRTEVAPALVDNERRVLYLGDLDRSGDDIERNAVRVLEREAGREFDWRRLAMTDEQAGEIEPIWKVDGRDGRGHEAWEVEALGQARVIAIVRAALDEMLPEPLADVREREARQREAEAAALGRVDGRGGSRR